MNKLLKMFILWGLAIMLFTFIIGYANQAEKAEEVVIETSVFMPDFDLLNEEMWVRVSEYRFESPFLRLAVEWEEGEYILLEMDGGHRILARSPFYSIISHKITELTIKF